MAAVMKVNLCLVLLSLRYRELCSCDDFEPSSPLELSLPDEARLFAAPGEIRTVGMTVFNLHQDGDPITLLVSHRENFYHRGDNFVQLVDSLTPTVIEGLLPNSSVKVNLTFKVPSYVKEGVQSKVTVIVEEPGFAGEKSERSFHFTVTSAPLAKFDRTEPECGQVTMCEDDCSEEEECNATFWRAELTGVMDNITGLRTVQPLVPGVQVLLPRDFAPGSIKKTKLMFTAECCIRGFEVRLADVAENAANCIVGIVSSTPSRSGGEISVFLSLGTWLTKFYLR